MRIASLILLVLGLTSCGVSKKTVENVSSTPQVELKSQEDLVKESFGNYKSAILNDQGEIAAEFVDSRTIKYYQEMLDYTISADSVAVNKLNIMDKLLVFSIRHRTTKDKILGFDGKKLLIYAIEEGMVGKNSVSNTEIGEVVVDDNFAKGQLVSKGTPFPVYFHFYKEEQSWKIDLTSIFPMAIPAFQQMAQESGQEENEYLFSLLGMLTGEQPTNKIWDTLIE